MNTRLNTKDFNIFFSYDQDTISDEVYTNMLKVWLKYFRDETLKIHDFSHIHDSEVKKIHILPVKHITYPPILQIKTFAYIC